MDLTAFTICKENNIPLIVFDMNRKGNLQLVVQGAPIGTLVC
jgi:uridylate kinase